MLAVTRVIEDGEAPSEVMKSFGLCRTAIYPWLRKYEASGMEALVEKIASGPESLFSEKQRQQVRKWILGKDPRQYGFDYGLWSRRIVQALIKERMGIECGLTAVGRLLASLNITPQKPLRRAYERDPEAVALWERETYPKLRKRAKRLGACQRRRQQETNRAVRNGSGTMVGDGNENGPEDRSTGPCRS